MIGDFDARMLNAFKEVSEATKPWFKSLSSLFWRILEIQSSQQNGFIGRPPNRGIAPFLLLGNHQPQLRSHLD